MICKLGQIFLLFPKIFLWTKQTLWHEIQLLTFVTMRKQSSFPNFQNEELGWPKLWIFIILYLLHDLCWYSYNGLVTMIREVVNRSCWLSSGASLDITGVVSAGPHFPPQLHHHHYLHQYLYQCLSPILSQWRDCHEYHASEFFDWLLIPAVARIFFVLLIYILFWFSWWRRKGEVSKC